MVDLKKYGLMVTNPQKAQAAYRGLLNASAQLMAGSAPSDRPGGLMRGLAAGGQAFTNTYDDAIAKQRALGMQKYQMDRQFKQDERAAATHDAGLKSAGRTEAAMAQLRLKPEYVGMPDALIMSAEKEKQKYRPPEKPFAVTSQVNGTPMQTFTTPSKYAADPSLFTPAIPPRKSKMYTPEEQTQALARAQAGKSLYPPAEKEESKKYGGDLVSEYTGIREQAEAAELQINNINMARSVSDVDDKGRVMPSVLQQKIGNVGVALGFDPNGAMFKSVAGNVSDGQSFVGSLQNLVLTKMQAQKGPQTENDAKRIEMTVASLGNTPEARDFLMRAASALANESLMKRKFWDNYRSKSAKKSFSGAASSWSEYKQKVPFMATSRKTGKPAFFSEFVRANKNLKVEGRKITMDELISGWAETHGNN